MYHIGGALRDLFLHLEHGLFPSAHVRAYWMWAEASDEMMMMERKLGQGHHMAGHEIRVCFRMFNGV